MPSMTLKCGRSVLIDPEDFDFVLTKTWRSWDPRLRYLAPLCVHDDYANGRKFRLRLHRVIAARMQPDLVPVMHRTKVFAKNGNYFDVRRENLEIVVRPQGRGKPKLDPRPRGYVAAKRASNAIDSESPLWSATAKRGPKRRRRKPARPDDNRAGSGGAKAARPT